MPLPPIPTQAADQVNISRQPKPELKKRPKRVEIEESNPVVFVRKIESHGKEHKRRPAGVA